MAEPKIRIDVLSGTVDVQKVVDGVDRIRKSIQGASDSVKELRKSLPGVEIGAAGARKIGSKVGGVKITAEPQVVTERREAVAEQKKAESILNHERQLKRFGYERATINKKLAEARQLEGIALKKEIKENLELGRIYKQKKQDIRSIIHFLELNPKLARQEGIELGKIRYLGSKQASELKEKLRLLDASEKAGYRNRLEIDRVSNSMRRLGTLGIVAFTAIMREATRFGIALTKLTKGYNLTVDEAFKLSLLAESSDVNIDELTTGIGNYFQKIITAGQGTSMVAARVREALAFAGVSAVRLGESGLPAIDMLIKMRKVFAELKEPQDKAYLGAMVFGNQYEKFIPLLHMSESAFQRILDRGDLLAKGLKGDWSQAVIDFNAEWMVIRNTFRILGIEVMKNLQPTFKKTSEIIERLIKAGSYMPAWVEKTISEILLFGPALLVVGGLFGSVLTNWRRSILMMKGSMATMLAGMPGILSWLNRLNAGFLTLGSVLSKALPWVLIVAGLAYIIRSCFDVYDALKNTGKQVDATTAKWEGYIKIAKQQSAYMQKNINLTDTERHALAKHNKALNSYHQQLLEASKELKSWGFNKGAATKKYEDAVRGIYAEKNAINDLMKSVMRAVAGYDLFGKEAFNIWEIINSISSDTTKSIVERFNESKKLIIAQLDYVKQKGDNVDAETQKAQGVMEGFVKEAIKNIDELDKKAEKPLAEKDIGKWTTKVKNIAEVSQDAYNKLKESEEILIKSTAESRAYQTRIYNQQAKDMAETDRKRSLSKLRLDNATTESERDIWKKNFDKYDKIYNTQEKEHQATANKIQNIDKLHKFYIEKSARARLNTEKRYSVEIRDIQTELNREMLNEIEKTTKDIETMDIKRLDSIRKIAEDVISAQRNMYLELSKFQIKHGLEPTAFTDYMKSIEMTTTLEKEKIVENMEKETREIEREHKKVIDDIQKSREEAIQAGFSAVEVKGFDKAEKDEIERFSKWKTSKERETQAVLAEIKTKGESSRVKALSDFAKDIVRDSSLSYKERISIGKEAITGLQELAKKDVNLSAFVNEQLLDLRVELDNISRSMSLINPFEFMMSEWDKSIERFGNWVDKMRKNVFTSVIDSFKGFFKEALATPSEFFKDFGKKMQDIVAGIASMLTEAKFEQLIAEQIMSTGKLPSPEELGRLWMGSYKGGLDYFIKGMQTFPAGVLKGMSAEKMPLTFTGRDMDMSRMFGERYLPYKTAGSTYTYTYNMPITNYFNGITNVSDMVKMLESRIVDRLKLAEYTRR